LSDPGGQKLRVDKWLWHARFFKTRTLAASELSAGHVRLNATRINKPAQAVAPGDVLTFAKGMGEFGATITFVSNIPGQTQTIPLAIDLLLETPGAEARVARLAGLSILLAATALAVSELMSRRLAARVGGG